MVTDVSSLPDLKFQKKSHPEVASYFDKELTSL